MSYGGLSLSDEQLTHPSFLPEAAGQALYVCMYSMTPNTLLATKAVVVESDSNPKDNIIHAAGCEVDVQSSSESASLWLLFLLPNVMISFFL